MGSIEALLPDPARVIAPHPPGAGKRMGLFRAVAQRRATTVQSSVALTTGTEHHKAERDGAGRLFPPLVLDGVNA